MNKTIKACFLDDYKQKFKGNHKVTNTLWSNPSLNFQRKTTLKPIVSTENQLVHRENIHKTINSDLSNKFLLKTKPNKESPLAFSHYKKLSITEIEKKLDIKHLELQTKAWKNTQTDKYYTGIINIERIKQWTIEKSRASEESTKKLNLKTKNCEGRYKIREINEKTNDFDYNFVKKHGRVRKLYSKILKTSKSPKYVCCDEYLSKQPYCVYQVRSLTPCLDEKVELKEIFDVKNSLAKRKIQCSIEQIACGLFDSARYGETLPTGSERLLKKW